MRAKIYLKLGDKVRHLNYCRWGIGEVIEEKNSSLPGGLCLVRILFEDGIERSFINNLDNEMCCYYTGIRLIEEFSIWET
ncbi:MAG TPA: hypothetical protein PKV92_02400 [Thermodesulfovibrio thiophilus]|uniref:hypothetical protein n=1 Tax=Thermodesulfovibrio thiophilus TaxID=340095 RepID=UPI0003F7EEB6|nr:hypothetical protein [Thermodesulfovibrio thiophilus]HHW20995.1 DUF3553 domain-containing protein [Thermodesulfovibrio thiophilus]HQD35934.1 hypothetical protein [Thermodesulfovibrio thiophilus]